MHFKPNVVAAQNLNREVMRMAEKTAEHQRDEKVLELILKAAPDAATLAAAIASLQWNSAVLYPATQHLKEVMKAPLEVMLMNEQVDAQKKLSETTERLTWAAVFFGAIQIVLAAVLLFK
jgi:hypothetical protein